MQDRYELGAGELTLDLTEVSDIEALRAIADQITGETAASA